MRRPLAALASTLLVVGALGCSSPFRAGSCPEAMAAARARGVETTCGILSRPSLLVEQANAALESRDFETAYQYLALLHTLHPDGAENREEFRLAARLFVESYFRNRIHTSSPWVTSEPTFMFGWLEEFFRGADEFPQPQVEAMFIGMHYGMFRDFLAYARGRPHFSAWVIVAKDDNGIIESIEGRRAERGDARTGSASAH